MENLKVGRIVHYVAYGTPGGEFPVGKCRAAIVTDVENATKASLCVLNPTGQYFSLGLLEKTPEEIHGEKVYEPGTWHDPRPCSR